MVRGLTDGVFNAWATAKWNVLGKDEVGTQAGTLVVIVQGPEPKHCLQSNTKAGDIVCFSTTRSHRQPAAS